jgi:hypothetical protein
LSIPSGTASPDIVFADSSDGYVSNTGDVSSVFAVGDGTNNQFIKSFVKFSLDGLAGKCLRSATLNVVVYASIRDDSYDNISPLTNPGLGDLQVVHIHDYGALDASDFLSSSIGNDPGVLISASAMPNFGYVSIAITGAMQADINAGKSFTSYVLKLQTNTDNDAKGDLWYFLPSENEGTSYDPFIEFTVGPCPVVGGAILLINPTALVLPWLGLVSILTVLIVQLVLMIRRRRAVRLG